ncbi:putative nuclease HARBI1 [Ornithodoros turicata]|uniref:putative nuclease HARBI1 n=1 Tax=Ornithodoros turicata TaxID=34597 RepID=UPI0031392547
MAWTYPARQKITTALLLRRLRRRRKRTMYIREIFDKRPYIGQYHNLVQELRQVDPEYHFKYFRAGMTKASFDRLLGLVYYRLLHPPNHRRPISPAERLAVTLRFLATGSSMQDTAINYCMHVSTVSNILSETLAAIWDCLSPLVLKPPTTAKWEKIRQVYSSRWNFPNVIGSIDGKHFAIRCPDRSVSDFFNYKGFYSIVLLAVADAEYRFILVDVGAQGRVSDGACFNESVSRNTLNVERLDYLHQPVGGLFVWWRSFLSAVTGTPDFLTDMVKAGVCLHNFLMLDAAYCPEGYADTVCGENVQEGLWRQTVTQVGCKEAVDAAARRAPQLRRVQLMLIYFTKGNTVRMPNELKQQMCSTSWLTGSARDSLLYKVDRELRF